MVVNPGLPPGVSRTPTHSGNPVGMSAVLTADVANDSGEILLAD
jgi:hypothetical protein